MERDSVTLEVDGPNDFLMYLDFEVTGRDYTPT